MWWRSVKSRHSFFSTGSRAIARLFSFPPHPFCNTTFADVVKWYCWIAYFHWDFQRNSTRDIGKKANFPIGKWRDEFISVVS
jgi:hypothetical protein